MSIDFLSLTSLVTVLAQDEAAADVVEHTAQTVGGGLIALGVGLGVGLASLGAAFGIGKLAASAVESMARQPEASGDIRGAMILTAAFIEGVCLFSVVVALMAVGKI